MAANNLGSRPHAKPLTAAAAGSNSPISKKVTQPDWLCEKPPKLANKPTGLRLQPLSAQGGLQIINLLTTFAINTFNFFEKTNQPSPHPPRRLPHLINSIHLQHHRLPIIHSAPLIRTQQSRPCLKTPFGTATKTTSVATQISASRST